MKNIIVLTHGWTGSSVFSSLFGQTGYWLGDKTMVKPDYDTHENAELVVLNQALMQQLAPALKYEHQFDAQQVLQIGQRAGEVDLAPLRRFAARCQTHQPWLWKDPRLTWTLRIWAQAMDLQGCAFLLLTREPLQAWISANNRRHVQSFRFTRHYNGGITRCNLDFAQSSGLPHLTLSFEDLLLQPEDTLDRLNDFTGTALQLSQLQAVCREPLYRRSRGPKDFVLASLIHLKNYGERDGRGRGVVVP